MQVSGRITVFFRTVASKTTRSMFVAIDDLHLARLFVAHAGDYSFPLAEKIQAISSTKIEKDTVSAVSPPT